MFCYRLLFPTWSYNYNYNYNEISYNTSLQEGSSYVSVIIVYEKNYT